MGPSRRSGRRSSAAAALLVLALARGWTGEPAFQEADRALALAERLVSRAAACADGPGRPSSGPGGLFADIKLPKVEAERAAFIARLSGACRAEVSVDWLLKEPEFTSGAAGTDALGDVKGYYMCRAAARRDPGLCAPLDSIPSKPGALSGNLRSSRESCEKFSRRLSTSKAIITGDPAAARLCRTMDLGEVPFTPEDQGPLCDILLTAEKDQDTACVKAKKIYTKYFKNRPPDTEPCEVEMRSYWGLEDLACGSLKTDPKGYTAPNAARTDKRVEEFCLFARANAAFRKASRGGDPELCGNDSPLCRAMLGQGPQACAPYAEQAKKKFCARLSAGVLPAGAILAVDRLSRAQAAAPETCSEMGARARAATDRVLTLLEAEKAQGLPGLTERYAKYYNMKARLHPQE